MVHQADIEDENESRREPFTIRPWFEVSVATRKDWTYDDRNSKQVLRLMNCQGLPVLKIMKLLSCQMISPSISQFHLKGNQRQITYHQMLCICIRTPIAILAPKSSACCRLWLLTSIYEQHRGCLIGTEEFESGVCDLRHASSQKSAMQNSIWERNLTAL